MPVAMQQSEMTANVGGHLVSVTSLAVKSANFTDGKLNIKLFVHDDQQIRVGTGSPT